MKCGTCGSDAMDRTSTFRLSGCLATAGLALVASAGLALLFGVLLAAVGPKATREASGKHESAAQAEAIEALQEIPNLPAGLIEEVRSKGKVSEETLAGLAPEQRRRVGHVMMTYHGARASSALATGTTAVAGTFVVVFLLGFAVVGGLAGLFLVRRRKVWRCRACGVAFDRT